MIRPHPRARESAPAAGRTPRRWPILAGLLLVVACLASLVGAPTSGADENPLVTVSLSEVRAAGTKPTDEVVLRGVVTNTGKQTIYSVQALIWRTRDPITEPELFLAALDSQVSSPYGERLAARAGNFYRITQPGQAFAAGASAPFEVRATRAELDLPSSGAVYLVGVHVRASLDESSNYQTVGRSRTFLPAPATTGTSGQVATLIVLTSRPSQLRPGLFADDHLAAELTGSLSTLLTTAANPAFSWVIDPALYAAVLDMADGYRVQSGSGTPTPGTGEAAAAKWLQAFSALPTRNGYRSLFALPDVTAAAHAGDTHVLSRALDAARSVDGLADLPLLVLPGGGRGDAATLAYAERCGAVGLLSALPVSDYSLLAGAGKLPIVRSSAMFNHAGPGPAPDNDFIHTRQRLEAEALVLGSAGQPQVRVVWDVDDLAVDAASASNWLKRVGLADVLAGTPHQWTPTYAADPGGSLPPAYLSRLGRLEADFAAYAELSPTSEFPAQGNAILSRAASVTFDGATAPATAYVNAAAGPVDRILGGAHIQLHAAPRFWMSASANEFPVTVTNELDEPVAVRVAFTSSNPLRLDVPDSDLIVVGAGESRTVNVRPVANGNGVVPVAAHLETSKGRTIGPEITIIIETSQVGAIGWTIVIASAVVLVASTAWQIRRNRRDRAREKP